MAVRLVDRPDLRNRRHVFRDRGDAGRILSDMLSEYRGGDATVLAIPAGGVPVAVEIARGLKLALDVLIVSKITFAWNTEAGYGALAHDGTLRLNDEMVARYALQPDQIDADLERTRKKVERRVTELRGLRPPLDPAGRCVIVVDDGLASGTTMRVAIETLAAEGATEVVVAVPTAHQSSLRELPPPVTSVFCANVRGGLSFAVADAYEHWCDVSEQEAAELLAHGPR